MFTKCSAWPLLRWALAICIVGGVAHAASRPNVLVIISDDLRPQLGCYGDPVVKTPHLDQFARWAMRFDRAYVQCAICSPSRNSFLSGLRPATSGLYGFGTTLREVRPKIVTLPQHFKNNGYYSAAFGKVFHVYAESILGSEDDAASWSQPLFLPKQPVWGPEQNALRDRLIAEARAAGAEFRHPHDWPRGETWDFPDVPDDALQDGEIASEAITFLQSRKHQTEPFFLAVGFLKPHLPFVAPRKYRDQYDIDAISLPQNDTLPDGAPRWSVNRVVVKNFANMPAPEEIDDQFKREYLRAYLACISYVDACAGRVLEALRQNGFADETLVVFLGDHGYQMGEYGSWGHKHSNYEISVRAPLLIAVPKLTSGQSTAALVEFLDLYPTLCDLAGLSIPRHVEGSSLLPVLQNPQTQIHNAVFSEMRRARFWGRSIRTDRYRLIEWTDAKQRVVARELYDHVSDPDENRSLAESSAHHHIVEQLAEQLRETLPVPDAPPGRPVNRNAP